MLGLDKVFGKCFMLGVTLFGIRLSNGLVIFMFLLVISWLRGGNSGEFLLGVYYRASVQELEFFPRTGVGVRGRIDLVDFGGLPPLRLCMPLGIILFRHCCWW